tara:strand:- start:263 stop:409 length:147 start_codon:yes stop_codon:yes gene_type:complete
VTRLQTGTLFVLSISLIAVGVMVMAFAPLYIGGYIDGTKRCDAPALKR